MKSLTFQYCNLVFHTQTWKKIPIESFFQFEKQAGPPYYCMESDLALEEGSLKTWVSTLPLHVLPIHNSILSIRVMMSLAVVLSCAPWAVWPCFAELSDRFSFWEQLLPVMGLPHQYYHQKGNFYFFHIVRVWSSVQVSEKMLEKNVFFSLYSSQIFPHPVCCG